MKTFVLTLAGLLISTFPTLAAPPATSTAKVVDLRVERMTNPEAVNHPLPRFGWRIETEEPGYFQGSYRILAASSAALLAQDKGDLWDSEEKPGRKSHFIPFGGFPLTTGQTAFWKVRSKEPSGKFTPWSEVAQFTVKLSGPPPLPSPLFLPVSEAARLSSFECSDPNLNKLYDLAAQRLHQISSVRDIGLTMRAAAYHQEIYPRASAWLHHMNASIDAAGFYPANLPSDGSYGSTRSDAAISATHAVWWMTGEQSSLESNWRKLFLYAAARMNIDPEGRGAPFGELPADTVPKGEAIPTEFIHICSEAIMLRGLLEMASIGTKNVVETRSFLARQRTLARQLESQHLDKEGRLRINSPTAYLMALRCGLLNDVQKAVVSDQLTSAVAKSKPLNLLNSPYASSSLMFVLTRIGRSTEAFELVQELDHERLSPIALSAISEWLISELAGINAADAGFNQILLRPQMLSKDHLQFAKARFECASGILESHWYHEDEGIAYKVVLPPNTFAHVELPGVDAASVVANGRPLAESALVDHINQSGPNLTFLLLPGDFVFRIKTAE